MKKLTKKLKVILVAIVAIFTMQACIPTGGISITSIINTQVSTMCGSGTVVVELYKRNTDGTTYTLVDTKTSARGPFAIQVQFSNVANGYYKISSGSTTEAFVNVTGVNTYQASLNCF